MRKQNGMIGSTMKRMAQTAKRTALTLVFSAGIMASAVMPASAQSKYLRQVDPSDFTAAGHGLYVSANVTEDQKNELLYTFEILPDGIEEALMEDNVSFYAWPESERNIIPGRSGVRGVYVVNQPVHRYIQVLSNRFEGTPDYATYRTLAHEIGHAVSDHAQRHPDKDEFYDSKTPEFVTIMNEEKENLKTIDPIGSRTYSKSTTGAEYFAEVFSMLCVDRESTEKVCPKSAAYVEKVTADYLAEHIADNTQGATEPQQTRSDDSQQSAVIEQKKAGAVKQPVGTAKKNSGVTASAKGGETAGKNIDSEYLDELMKRAAGGIGSY